jgi:hypothetical protein
VGVEEPGLQGGLIVSDRDVHTEHCCKRHGCKYNDRKCSVETGKKVQSYPCEYCGIEGEANKTNLAELKEKVIEITGTLDLILPIKVKRVGPIELNLTFEPEPGWSASFSYKVTRRNNSQRFSITEVKLSAEKALEALLEQARRTALTGERAVGDF